MARQALGWGLFDRALEGQQTLVPVVRIREAGEMSTDREAVARGLGLQPVAQLVVILSVYRGAAAYVFPSSISPAMMTGPEADPDRPESGGGCGSGTVSPSMTDPPRRRWVVATPIRLIRRATA